jgi:predicted  nucleic acid-binding Zn-ribbon protein
VLLKADPTHQVKLLDVAELDSRTAQLRHQRAHLPELAEIAEIGARRTDVDNRARDARIAVDDLTVEQKKVDLDVEAVKTRRTRDRDRMDQGLITNPKDLERMQHELESLERRITSLEDDELEVMEKIEEAQRELSEYERMVAETDERLAALATARDEKIAAIDEQLAKVQADRGPAAEGLPEDLVKLYLRLRESKGGVGAAALRARTCSGCQLSLDSVELSRIKGLPEDEVVRCEECDRILVRTPESGL